MDDRRNMILAIALSMVILVAWQYFIGAPRIEKERQRQIVAEQQAASGTQPGPGGAPSSSAPTPGQSAAPAVPGGAPASQPALAQSRADIIAATPRIAIASPKLGGSIALKGARVDDVILKDYRETVDPGSPPITLFSPAGSMAPYYAEYGWAAAQGQSAKLPTSDTLWSAQGNTQLTPATPVTLTYDNGEGLTFAITYAIDDNYMIAVTQAVENRTQTPVILYPYGLIARHGTPPTQGFFVLHEGLIGVLGEAGLQEVGYDDITDSRLMNFEASKGWLGFTDKYWAAALVPGPAAPFTARMQAIGDTANVIYQTDYLGEAQTVAPGARVSATANLFAGAKEVDAVDDYETELGIYQFDLLIDWGWFYFITKPLFYGIDYFFRLVGNFGVAILIVTVLVKLAFFPLANKSYVSMSRMKMVQPEMVAIRERFKDDRMKQQQAMMELYKKEKINPAAGCVPILLQIPVFFALYKVLFVTIEMRHAPFFGWIKDLAAPDPTSLFNLFGLIPFDPPQFLMIGVWPLIMGVTMFVQMRLNPPPPDPTQAMIFNWMPLFFTFLLASFPAGLVIYWAWNNTLSIIQQAVIMKRQGAKIELWDNLLALFKKKPSTKPGE